jgi:4-hydroxy-2-oxoglutarate aldolase
MTLKEKLTGIFPPVMTPFNKGKIDLPGLAFNIEKMNSIQLRGYMPLGSNGEFRSLTDDESIDVLKTIVRAKSAGKVLMAGTQRESAYATIEFTKRAADAGADFASVLTPHYYAGRMNDEALIRFYTEVAGGSPIPVLMYNAPKFAAGVTLSAAAVTVLAAHPNIVGMKDTSKEDIARYVKAVPPGTEFYVLAGSITKFLYGLRNGAVGGILSPANYFPELCREIQTLFEAGKITEAQELSDRLISLNGRTAGKYGVAGVKGAMNLFGYKGGEPRVPVLPVTVAELEEMRAVYTAEGYLN